MAKRRPKLFVRKQIVLAALAILLVGAFGYRLLPKQYGFEVEPEAGQVRDVVLSNDPVSPGNRFVEFAGPNEAAGLPQLPVGTSWQLVFSDEFTGSMLDKDKWNTPAKSNYGAGNKEDQCYMDGHVSVGGGRLGLIASQEETDCHTNPDTGQPNYYFRSGLVTTRAQNGPLKFKFRYGYIEAGIKHPKGNPFVGDLWLASPLDGTTPGWPYYGDISISEVVGGRPSLTHGQLHYPCNQSLSCKTTPSIYNLATKSPHGWSTNFGEQLSNVNFDSYEGETSKRYVRYGLWWEPHKLTWFVDGRPVRIFDGKQLIGLSAEGIATVEAAVGSGLLEPNVPFEKIFGYEHSVVLSLAVGGIKAQSRDYGYCGKEIPEGYDVCNLAATFPAQLEVDYIRIFQTK